MTDNKNNQPSQKAENKADNKTDNKATQQNTSDTKASAEKTSNPKTSSSKAAIQKPADDKKTSTTEVKGELILNDSAAGNTKNTTASQPKNQAKPDAEAAKTTQGQKPTGTVGTVIDAKPIKDSPEKNGDKTKAGEDINAATASKTNSKIADKHTSKPTSKSDKNGTPPPTEPPTPTEPPASSKPSKGNRWIALIAILLSLLALSAAGYVWWQAQQETKTLQSELEKGQANTANQTAIAEQLAVEINRLQKQLAANTNTNQQQQQQLQAELQQARRSIQQNLQKQLATVDAKLAAQANLSKGQREAIQLAEVEYLLAIALRQANLNNDAQATITALNEAENILNQANLVGVYPAVTAAIAQSRSQLQNVKSSNKTQITADLKSLANDANLPGLKLKNTEVVSQQAADVKNNQSASSGCSWRDCRPLFYFEPVEPQAGTQVDVVPNIMPNQAKAIRQNLATQFQIVSLYVAQNDTESYQNTLKNAADYLNYWFEDNAASQSMQQRITKLAQQSLQVEMPKLNVLQQALLRLKTASPKSNTNSQDPTNGGNQ